MGTLERDRFDWVEDLRKGVIFLLDEAIHPRFELRQGNNPLEAMLTIALTRPLPKASRAPFRMYIRFWAKTGDCEIPRIHIRKLDVVAEVLFKYVHPRGKTRDENEGDEKRPGDVDRSISPD